MDKHIAKFSLDDIIKLESQDLQFLALKNAWNQIAIRSSQATIDQNLFLFLILQNWLVSYQIAWSWENRRTEFSQKIEKDWTKISKDLINKKDNIDRRYNFLTTSKYNKRIYNIKKSRLIRFNKFLKVIDRKDENFFLNHYQNMSWLLNNISKTMDRSPDSKTMTFAIKMFWYWARIVFDKTIYYPHEIKIPIDSRLQKIYEIDTWKKLSKTAEDKKLIAKYFDSLSQKHSIPPLHLDSILRIDYRKKIK